MLPANLDTALSQHIAQQPAASERILQMQFVDLPHQLQVGFRDRARPIVEAAAAEPKQVYLLLNRELFFTRDHLLALSSPALVSARSKKSFSSVSSPILACIRVTSTLTDSDSLLSSPNTPAARSCNRIFHSVIWLGCTSNCCANQITEWKIR